MSDYCMVLHESLACIVYLVVELQNERDMIKSLPANIANKPASARYSYGIARSLCISKEKNALSNV